MRRKAGETISGSQSAIRPNSTGQISRSGELVFREIAAHGERAGRRELSRIENAHRVATAARSAKQPKDARIS